MRGSLHRILLTCLRLCLTGSLLLHHVSYLFVASSIKFLSQNMRQSSTYELLPYMPRELANGSVADRKRHDMMRKRSYKLLAWKPSQISPASFLFVTTMYSATPVAFSPISFSWFPQLAFCFIFLMSPSSLERIWIIMTSVETSLIEKLCSRVRCITNSILLLEESHASLVTAAKCEMLMRAGFPECSRNANAALERKMLI